ncbi:hypothetical protein BABINDRAFT_149167 [Babjeviella inositovora NRRL Y-12698]|uniref:RING-type domain-containing protein n=1 Tax=Babjeviella inositovora NRRL Y-12698 TaxID=984486 RepID=A0A1E3QN85_9ASCO|nr:uncharacterized protein BABINDRAFT_149167 [Babjeviella inositovora NRRL Y-12698]ODQ79169.1 hypothetical protein BABINDRAFT_149167 [Babjeviella inositovora NRRL Y-12698]
MGSDSSEEARRIIVTVNYIVGENVGLNDGRRGQLVLSVPDVPASQNVQELITFATSVALRAFVTREPPKKGGCTTEEFLQLTVLDQEQLSEEQSLPCSICFEDYEFPTTKKRDLETAEGGGRTKRRKTNNGMPVNTAVSETPVETATGVEKPAKELLSESTIAFEHEPVQLECSHLFGRSCLSEWLKANTTCPLCRHQVVKSSEASAVPVIPPIFVVLPNLSEYYRDVLTQRGGQPNLLVLNGNHQLTRDNIRRLTGLGYLIAVRDDDGSVIRAHLGDVEGTEGNNSDIRSRLFRWSELSRLGRPGTNSSEADRTVDLSVPNTQGTPASAESTAPPSRLGLPRVRQFFDRLIGDIMGGPQRGVGLPGRRLDMLFPGESPTGIPTRPFDMLLPMGVASRRTADGVHTFGFRGENYDEMPRQESAGSLNGNDG